jgi:hypothetical protein
LKYLHSKNIILFPGYGELSATCLTCTKFRKFILLHASCHTDIIIVFRRLRSEKRKVASSCLLVIPYAHIGENPKERIFAKFCVSFFNKIFRKFRNIGYNLTKMRYTLH